MKYLSLPVLQVATISLAILGAYAWLHSPTLTAYSLQAFAASMLVYFVFKRFHTKAELWHIAPTTETIEIAFASFGFLLLIGSTGNATSPFFPLSYIHLFFLAFSLRKTIAIGSTLMILLFHLGLDSTLSTLSIVNLLSLPGMLIIFLFSKAQYLMAKQESREIAKEKQQIESLTDSTLTATLLIEKTLFPTVETVKQTLQNIQADQALISKVTELENIIKQIKETLRNHAQEESTKS